VSFNVTAKKDPRVNLTATTHRPEEKMGYQRGLYRIQGSCKV
jgi:hypothetical protein